MSVLTVFAADGEPCSSCGAPLAADQRYCLACGVRRTTARIPFLDILREEPSTQLHQLPQAPGMTAGPVTWSGPPDGSLAGRARAYSGLIAGVGVLLLAMLIGVLLGSGIGSDGRNTALADQKPIVVSVGGGAAPVAQGAVATTPPDASSGASSKPGPKAKAKKTSKVTIKPKTASAKKLKDLSKLSGKAYQKQVDKLGKNIAVGGKAPPKDKKAPAGGGAFQEIG